MLSAKEKKTFKYLFGPVRSRRLGISLGIDLVPAKTCTFNCVYCEAGKTTDMCLKRKKFFPSSDIIAELKKILSSNPKLDFITFSGAGEPALNSDIGKIISWIKSAFPKYKICLITNGLLISAGKLSEELKKLDLVMPSLDAPTEEIFQKINRPPPDVSLKMLVDSLISFRRKNPVKMWLEIFLVPGINDSSASLKKFFEIISKINPDKIQLNGLDRPSSESWVRRPGIKTLEIFQKTLGKICPVELILKPKGRFISNENSAADIREKIISLVTRRPSTIEEIAMSVGIKTSELKKILPSIISSGDIEKKYMQRGIFIVKPAKVSI